MSIVIDDRLEEVVRGAWEMTLGISVEPEDDFFDLGGDSMLGLMIVSALEDQLGVEFDIRELFERPTVRHMTEVLTVKGIAIP
jgi:acyl carrier protein